MQNGFCVIRMAPEMMIVTGNSKNPHWNLEDGYDTSVPLNETYPHRVFGAGARAGFFALLKLNDTDAEYVCRGPVQVQMPIFKKKIMLISH